jgi:hypothetical protein
MRRDRQPYKVRPELAERMRRLRAEGKTYAVIAGLCAVSPECARKWLRGLTPARPQP